MFSQKLKFQLETALKNAKEELKKKKLVIQIEELESIWDHHRKVADYLRQGMRQGVADGKARIFFKTENSDFFNDAQYLI